MVCWQLSSYLNLDSRIITPLVVHLAARAASRFYNHLNKDEDLIEYNLRPARHDGIMICFISFPKHSSTEQQLQKVAIFQQTVKLLYSIP